MFNELGEEMGRSLRAKLQDIPRGGEARCSAQSNRNWVTEVKSSLGASPLDTLLRLICRAGYLHVAKHL